MIKNKKGITEIISFVLLTLLIVVSSTTAYFFSKDIIDSKIEEQNRDYMLSLFKELGYKIGEIQNFDSASFAINLQFHKGLVKFEGNKIYYISSVEYTGNLICFDNVCHDQLSGYEILFLNITSLYEFKDNFTLDPDNYFLTFINIKNESKIKVQFS